MVTIHRVRLRVMLTLAGVSEEVEGNPMTWDSGSFGNPLLLVINKCSCLLITKTPPGGTSVLWTLTQESLSPKCFTPHCVCGRV